MGRKSKPKLKPFCYYCERVFDDEMVLVTHQKAKHFKCHHCQKKLGSAHSLTVHVFQVHKETLKVVPNAKKGRDSLELGIFGMQNIPPDVLAQKQTEQFGGQQPPAKKLRKEDEAPNSESALSPTLDAVALTSASAPGELPAVNNAAYAVHPYAGYIPPAAPWPSVMPTVVPPTAAEPVEQVLIYDDENFSVEEKRAILAKYKSQNAEAALDRHVNSLQESIQERLRSLQAEGATV